MADNFAITYIFMEYFMIRKIISLCLILILSLFLLTGCYDARGVETLAYAVAIGLDKGENNILKLSIQFASSGDSGEGGSSSQYTDTTVTTVECTSLDSGINLINSYMSKQVNLSHCKIIVFSETLAREGIADYISTLKNNTEIRPDCNIIVSRCNASDFLNASSPGLETLSARYYELVLNSSEYTGYTENITLYSFFFSYSNSFIEPIAILGGINSENTHKQDKTTSYVSMDGDYKADETPIKDKASLENMGLAVFKRDKLVGELTGIESLCHLLVTNKFKSSSITIPSPFEQNGIIDLSITRNKNTSNTVQLVNGYPYIKCSINIDGAVLSASNDFDFTKEDNLRILEEYAKSYLQEKIASYLYKTSKEFNADIVGFGRQLSKNYLTLSEFDELNWLNLYKDSFFEVDVTVNVRSSQLIVKN